jgi:Phosphotransferase enzyme family
MRKPCELSANDSGVTVFNASSTRAVADQLRSAGFEYVHRFASVPSGPAARWVLPVGNSLWTECAIKSFAAYSWRTRLFKEFLLTIDRVGLLGWVGDNLILASKEPLPLDVLVGEVTGEFHPVLTVSLGTPTRFRKLTIQVMRSNGEILGYIKLPITKEAVARVRQEATSLERLKNCDALHSRIPRLLYSGEWANTYILFQSAGSQRPGPVEFGVLHDDFLQRLRTVAPLEKPGSVLVDETAAIWQKAEPFLTSKWRSLGGWALARARQVLAKATVPCGIIHGDFAPWNTRVDNGHLYVFDWESTTESAPLDWDMFHFNIQVASLLKRKFDKYLYSGRSPQDRACLLLYILNSVRQSFEERGPVENAETTFRMQLLSQFC